MTADHDLRAELQHRIDQKTKPVGALGRLEELALRLGMIQQTVNPRVSPGAIYVFAADHGIAAAGVSAFPQAVTFQMVLNFLQGGSAINVFARESGLSLVVVDAGIAEAPPAHEHLVSRRMGPGTRNFLDEPAMSRAKCEEALEAGRELMADAQNQGIRLVGFGEMGIGNTSSAAILTSLFSGASLERCVGRGTGLDDAGFKRKAGLLAQAVAARGSPADAVDRLSLFGGFEMAMMAGAMLEAARRRMVILVDGFIVSAALAAAHAIEPSVLECCVFSHRSCEPGHEALLKLFKADPLLDLSLRLGEGSGAALAYPLVKAAAAFLNDMATFDSAKVDGKTSA
jgi:nicotinate-nucleotide--dimethylbenzimidazole phosphoribosyltransferase